MVQPLLKILRFWLVEIWSNKCDPLNFHLCPFCRSWKHGQGRDNKAILIKTQRLPRSVTSFCITCPMLNNLFSDIVSILLRTVLFFSILQSFVSWVSKHVLLMLSYYRTKFSPNDSFIANIYSDLIAILFRNCFENIDGFMNDLQLYLGWFQINISASALLNQAWLFKSFSNSGSTFWQLIK